MSEIDKMIIEKLEKLDSRIDNIDITLAKQSVILENQHASLEVHIKRTDLLEAKLEPVEKHVDMVAGALKLIGLIGAMIGIITGLLKLVSIL